MYVHISATRSFFNNMHILHTHVHCRSLTWHPRERSLARAVEVLGMVNTKAMKGGNKFMKVKVTHVVQGKMNKDGSYTRTGNKTVVMTEK